MNHIKTLITLSAICLACTSCLGQSKENTTAEPVDPAVRLLDRLEKSEHFEKYTNDNGIVTYYLDSPRLAKHQIGMYYTTPCITDDGRYVWFWLTEDRSDFSLALYDAETDEVYQYDGMEVHTSSSYVDTATGDVYWVSPAKNQKYAGDVYYILKRGPEPKDRIKKVARIPHYVDNCPPPRQVVTHLFPSADGKSFGFDSGHYRTNNKTYIGTVPNDINGEAQLWTILERRYDHGQMSPKYSDVMLVTQDYFTDYIGQFGEPGGRLGPDNRMWIVYSDGEAKPVFEDDNDIYHEWWDASGDWLWYIDKKGNKGGKGVCKVKYDYVNRSFGEPELIWPDALGHACGSKSGKYIVGDHGYKSWATTNSCRLSFYNIATGKEANIVTSLPYSGSMNHTHPCFAMNDAVVCYTFSTGDYNAVAFTFTENLIELTN